MQCSPEPRVEQNNSKCKVQCERGKMEKERPLFVDMSVPVNNSSVTLYPMNKALTEDTRERQMGHLSTRRLESRGGRGYCSWRWLGKTGQGRRGQGGRRRPLFLIFSSHYKMVWEPGRGPHLTPSQVHTHQWFPTPEAWTDLSLLLGSTLAMQNLGPAQTH